VLNRPTINKLMKNVDSKYTLVIVAAKRARYVIDHHPDMLASGMINPVSMALNEVSENKLHWDNGHGLKNRRTHS